MGESHQGRKEREREGERETEEGQWAVDELVGPQPRPLRRLKLGGGEFSGCLKRLSREIVR